MPAWNPLSLLGYPFHAELQTGVYCPINWLLWIVGATTGSFGPWLIHTKIFLFLWIGLCGMHALVQHSSGDRLAAAFGALVYCFGAATLTVRDSALLWPLMLLPWCAWSLLHFLAQPSLRRVLALTIAVWCCGSSGNPPSFFYSIFSLLGVWTIFTLIPARYALGRVRKQLPYFVLFAALELFLLMPTYWPAVEMKAWSVRANLTSGYATDRPIPLNAFVEMLWPSQDANWFIDIYSGPLAIVLATSAILCAPTSVRRARRIGLFAMVALASLLALGEKGQILPWLAEHVPGFGLFRFAHRYKHVLGFFLPWLAALGFADWRRSPSKPRTLFSLAPVLLSFGWIAASMFALHRGSAANFNVDPIRTAMWAGGSSLALFCAALFWTRARKLLLVLAVAVSFVDLLAAGQPIINVMTHPRDYERLRARVGRPAGLLAKTWRYYDRKPKNHAMIYNIREFGGYEELPLRQQRFDTLRRVVGRSPHVLGHFNVRWAWFPNAAGIGIRPMHGDLIEITHPTSRVRTYRHAVETTDDAALQTLQRQARPLDTALITSGAAKRIEDSAPAPAIDGEVLLHEMNKIIARASTPAPAVMVLNEAYYPGWVASVNGRPTPIFRANYMLRAVEIPSGTSTVVFEYRGHRTATFIFFLGLTLVLALVTWANRRPFSFQRRARFPEVPLGGVRGVRSLGERSDLLG